MFNSFLLFGYIDTVCYYYCLIILDFVMVNVSKKASDVSLLVGKHCFIGKL